MRSDNRTRPLDSISQGDQTTREYVLARPRDGNPYQWEAVNLEDADRVGLSLTHVSGGGSMVDDGACSIEEPEEGLVSYTFSRSETWMPAGDYHAQFHIEWSDGNTENLPPDGYTWWVSLGPKQGGVPIHTPRIRAEVGVIDQFESDHIDTDTIQVNDWIGGLIGDASESNTLSRIDGPNLEVGPTGSLGVVDPFDDGYPEGGDHVHGGTGEGGDQLYPRDLRTAHDPINVTHPDYGAAGDGSTDDYEAIQAAFDKAVDLAATGDCPTVYFPSGVYWVEDIPELRTSDGGITIRGEGSSSQIKPRYGKPDGTARSEFNPQDNALSIGGEGSSARASNITVRDLHINGGEGQWGEELADDLQGDDPIVYNQWARLDIRNIDGLTVENVTGESLTHLIYQRNNTNVSVSDIRLTDGFCPVHQINSTDGTITNVVGDRVECLADWGTCENWTLSNAVGTVGYRAEDEVIDVGGSGNISVTNVIGHDFPVGAQIKEEGGNPFIGCSFDNCHFYGVGIYGFNLNTGDFRGASDGNRRITISDSVVEGVGNAGSVGVNAQQDVRDLTIDNLKTYTEGPGIDLTAPERVWIGGGTYLRSRDAACLTMSSGGSGSYERPVLEGVRANCRADEITDRIGIISISGAERLEMSDVNVWGTSPHRGVNLSNCLMPDIDVKTSQTGAQGVVAEWTNTDYIAGTSSQIGANIKANVENHGMENTEADGVRIIIDLDSTTTAGDVHVTNMARMTPGENRRGERVNQGGTHLTLRGSVTELDNSTFDLTHMYTPESFNGSSNLGANVESDVFHVAP